MLKNIRTEYVMPAVSFFGTDSEKTEKLFRLVKEKFSKNWGWIIYEHLRPYGGTDAVYKRVAKYLKECLDEAGITNYSQDDFEKSVTILLDLVVSTASRHPNLTTTLVFNLSGIGQAHYPELCLAWMQSMDENYTTDAEGSFSTGKYRIVRINCPIDVTVYDAGGMFLRRLLMICRSQTAMWWCPSQTRERNWFICR